MTSYVWIEWICRKCEELHRMKFEIVPKQKFNKRMKGIVVSQEDCLIEDYPFDQGDKKHAGTKSKWRHGSRIYVKWNTEITDILSLLESYMQEYYSIEKDTLSMEVCRT